MRYFIFVGVSPLSRLVYINSFRYFHFVLWNKLIVVVDYNIVFRVLSKINLYNVVSGALAKRPRREHRSIILCSQTPKPDLGQANLHVSTGKAFMEGSLSSYRLKVKNLRLVDYKNSQGSQPFLFCGVLPNNKCSHFSLNLSWSEKLILFVDL